MCYFSQKILKSEIRVYGSTLNVYNIPMLCCEETNRYLHVKMNKTIKSLERKLLFNMISKYELKKQEKEAECQQKQDCLHISDF